MLPLLRRWLASLLVLSFLVILYTQILDSYPPQSPIDKLTRPSFFRPKFQWKHARQRYPVQTLTQLPTGPIAHIPKIQIDEFPPETHTRRVERQVRLNAVKEAFMHSWEGYRKNAWLQDEVAPISGSSSNGFGGWSATLIDSLDTIWIMGLDTEWHRALAALKHIDFTTTPLDTINVFETTIRYLGGLLGAYDVSGHRYPILLEKAIDVGEMLYVAFDTPNRCPVTRWDWKNGALGGSQEAARHSLVAEVGSLTLEFTRLSQLTGEHKWYDAVARMTDIFEDSQNRTKIPGLWATMIDTKNADFTRDTTFTLGGMADSLYEYLPKQYLMLGGRSTQYRNMYTTALESLREHIFFRPLNPANKDLLIAGSAKRTGARLKLIPEGQHLTCFAGGMVALAAKAFARPENLETARQLLDGCLWAADSMPSGIMPEIFLTAPCKSKSPPSLDEEDPCTWSNETWYDAISARLHNGRSKPNPAEEAQALISSENLAPGFTEIRDARYLLRPEAIESIFILYRITGDATLQDRAWGMFRAITNATRTAIAYASLNDVTTFDENDDGRRWADSMESFWMAETLKYFYLIFEETDVISLDEYVLNTEAHPFLRPTK